MEKSEFKKALETRLDSRLKVKAFDDLTVGGSKLRFEVAMAIDGYPFEIPSTADESDYLPLITTEQLFSGDYDSIIDEVFTKALEKSMKTTDLE